MSAKTGIVLGHVGTSITFHASQVAPIKSVVKVTWDEVLTVRVNRWHVWVIRKLGRRIVDRMMNKVFSAATDFPFFFFLDYFRELSVQGAIDGCILSFNLICSWGCCFLQLRIRGKVYLYGRWERLSIEGWFCSFHPLLVRVANALSLWATLRVGVAFRM